MDLFEEGKKMDLCEERKKKRDLCEEREKGTSVGNKMSLCEE